MANGKVAQVIGTVVDVEFPPEELPAIYNAVEITMDAGKLVTEVQQHLGNNLVRCLAMAGTDGLRRGAEAVDTGLAIAVPAGPGTMRRLFNVLGDPLDDLGQAKQYD